MSATHFTLLNKSYFRRFLHQLHSTYTGPSRDLLANDLLDEVYANVKKEVDMILDQQSHLNIIIDERTDISGNRIVSMCFMTDIGSFHHTSQNMGSIEFR